MLIEMLQNPAHAYLLGVFTAVLGVGLVSCLAVSLPNPRLDEFDWMKPQDMSDWPKRPDIDRKAE